MQSRRTNLLWLDTLLCTIFTVSIASVFYLLFVNVSILDPFYKAFKDFSFTDVYYSKSFYEKDLEHSIILVNIKHHDRLSIAQAIEKIELNQPKVIGLDIIFKDQKQPYLDSILKTTLLGYNNLVTSYYVDNDSIIRNHSYFRNANEREGYINVNLKNQDAVIRDFVGVDITKDTTYAFATQIAMQYKTLSHKNIKKLRERIPINYTGNQNSFLTFDIDEILENEGMPIFKNAIVLFGYLGNPTGNEFDIEDKHFTPLNTKFAGRSTPDMFGLVIHANIIKMLIQDNFITKISKFFSYLIALTITFFVIMLGMKLYKKSTLAYDILIKIIQLVLSVLLLYMALLLLKVNVYLYITPVLVLSLLGLEMIDFYIYVIAYLNKRFKWKSYLLD